MALFLNIGMRYNADMIPTGSMLSGLVITEGMDMSRLSSFSTGGRAEYYAEPRSVFDAVRALEMAYRKNLAVTVIGAGTHVLVSDDGIPGLVISTASMRGMSIKGRLLVAAPGESLDNVINQAIDHNLTGLEEIAGIPGTIAGALSVNAAANSTSISDFLFYADYLTVEGEAHRRPGFHDPSRSQRSLFQPGELIISIALRLRPARATAEARMRKEEYVERMYIPPCRRFSGIIYRDPPGMSAARIIRECGLTGPSGLKAEFSEYQPNSIVTYPGCTSSEIYALIEHGRMKAKEHGYDLETSVALLGSFTGAP